MMTQRLDPRIGCLLSGKFYAYVGPERREVVGTQEAVELALGIAQAVAPAPQVASRPRRVLRDYVVTVKPGIESWNVKTYDVTISASDRAAAIAEARATYQENTQWTNGAATYRARLA